MAARLAAPAATKSPSCIEIYIWLWAGIEAVQYRQLRRLVRGEPRLRMGRAARVESSAWDVSCNAQLVRTCVPLCAVRVCVRLAVLA